MSEECGVRCRARKGLFDDEVVIRLQALDASGHAQEIQSLAYGDRVKGTGDPDDSGEYPAVVKAYCLGRSEELAALVLPQSTFQNGPNILVRTSELVES